MTVSKLSWALLCLPFIGMAATPHPVPESPKWLTYQGGEGPGAGKHIVLVAAEQEYRSEQSMPMMAKILAKHHGFHTTVLFALNEDGLVDPTMPVYPKKGEADKFKSHSIPGLEHLATADLLILKHRLLTLPNEQLEAFVTYFDSGKPIIGLRTANHGFRSRLPYEVDGKRVNVARILGGGFMNHHGRWHADSTRGSIDKDAKDHPIVIGVDDVWGPSDVYRTYKEGTSLPEGCTALVWGQPLTGRNYDDPPNTKKEPLPVAWYKTWTTTKGEKARVVQSTMGSAKDLQSAGLRRLVINSAYWCMGMEDKIAATNSVEIVGPYEPLTSGFNYKKLGVVPKKPEAYK